MNIIKELKNTRLFYNMDLKEIEKLLEMAQYYIKEYEKGSDVYPAESPISHAGIILSGEIDVLHIHINGDEELLGRNGKGDIIGPAFCITGMINNLSYFRVRKKTKLLLLNINSVISAPVSESYYSKFAGNIMNILAHNNIILNKKIQLLTQKSLRKKLLTYFIQLSDKVGSRNFNISFNREQLAQYLCSERSSVCRELGRMQDEGLIRVDGNSITLMDKSILMY
ncbi:MAG: Crp/Fnr family transcriptional regulator [Eubacterium sp.]|nr:Crp/Fnr family transcriptional regulator [Eubacterium sp.]